MWCLDYQINLDIAAREQAQGEWVDGGNDYVGRSEDGQEDDLMLGKRKGGGLWMDIETEHRRRSRIPS